MACSYQTSSTRTSFINSQKSTIAPYRFQLAFDRVHLLGGWRVRTKAGGIRRAPGIRAFRLNALRAACRRFAQRQLLGSDCLPARWCRKEKRHSCQDPTEQIDSAVSKRKKIQFVSTICWSSQKRIGPSGSITFSLDFLLNTQSLMPIHVFD